MAGWQLFVGKEIILSYQCVHFQRARGSERVCFCSQDGHKACCILGEEAGVCLGRADSVRDCILWSCAAL